ncbi:MAG: glycosyltransferase family 39 protein [Planctomycetes bacterium]|nr:glycosyltransferase family 39 protein [Planctomycetota bacterium]
MSALVEPPPSRAPRWGVALGLFALAFGLRAAFLFASSDAAWPHSMRYEGDAPVWARWAAALARGESFEYDLPLRAPGAAYLVHLLGGPPFETLKLAWCALSAATVASLYLVVGRLAGTRVGLLAAVWLAFSFGDYQLATSLNNETPYALALLASVALTVRWVERPALASSLALGVVHGAASLLRAEHVAFVALASAWALVRVWPTVERRSRALVGTACVALALLATCAPWAWRAHVATWRFNHLSGLIDYHKFVPPWSGDAWRELDRLPGFARRPNATLLTDLRRAAGDDEVGLDDVERFFADWGSTPEPIAEWTLVTWKAPLDFALANHPASDGGFSRAALQDGRDPDPTFSFARPSHLRLLNHGWSIGWESLAGDPAQSASLLAAKLARFADGATLGFGARDLPYGAGGVRRPIDLTVPVGGRVWRLLIGAVLACGAWLAWRRRVGGLFLLVLLYKLAVTLAFYGYARQAASIGFVFAFLGALALDELVSRVRTAHGGAGRALGWSLGFAAVALLAVDVTEWRSPTAFEVRSTAPTPRIVSPSEWGSVESFDELVLTPR